MVRLNNKTEQKILTEDQLEKVIETHKNLQELIDLATTLRKSGKAKDLDYFNYFFAKSSKLV